MAISQQKAKQVTATAKLKINMISSVRGIVRVLVSWIGRGKDLPIPRRIAANVICSSLKMKTRPPHARKKLAIASVGGRDGRIECGGRNQRKKYVKHRRTAKLVRKKPHKA